MKRLLAVLAVLGAMGCGSASTAGNFDGGSLKVVSADNPATFASKAMPAMGDFLKLHIGAGVSGLWPQSSDYINETYMIDITGQIDILLGLSAEVSLGWATYDYDDGGYQGKLSVMPLYASAFYTMGAGNIKGYFGGGLQWEITDASDISSLDTNDPVGYHLTAGVSLSQGRFSVQAEARYAFSEVTVDYSNPADPDIQFKDDTLQARVKFLLNF